MKAKLLIALALVMGVAVNSVSAQARDGRNQRERIEEGYRNRELTGPETRFLNRQQLRIHRLYQHFMRDGYLSRREKRILMRERERAHRQTYRYKHNRFDRDDRFDGYKEGN